MSSQESNHDKTCQKCYRSNFIDQETYYYSAPSLTSAAEQAKTFSIACFMVKTWNKNFKKCVVARLSYYSINVVMDLQK